MLCIKLRVIKLKSKYFTKLILGGYKLLGFYFVGATSPVVNSKVFRILVVYEI